MPKVIITPSPAFNPMGVRLLLGEVGVNAMLQDDTTITCMMSEDQISRFRNGRGAAHKVEIVPEAPPPVIEENTFTKSDHVSVEDEAPDKPEPPPSKGPQKVA